MGIMARDDGFLAGLKGLFDSAIVPPRDSPSLSKDMGSKAPELALFKVDSKPLLGGSDGSKTVPPLC